MISLRQHIDAYDKQLADALRSACGATLVAVGKSGGQAVPDLATSLRASLNSLCERVASAATSAEVAAIEADVGAALAGWGADAIQSSLDSMNEVREVMMTVAASAAAIADRDHRYTHRFKELTGRLHSAAKLHDIGSMRQSVIESAAEMKSCMEEMAEEGRRSLSQLQAQVAHYRAELKEFQKRDTTDKLTGLANRETIEAQIQERMSWSSKFCIAMMDLNGFKRVNDTWGHAAGDELLKQFATEVQARLRSTDLIGRWGGDEFVFIIDSSLEEASKSMARLRDWVFGEYELGSGSEKVRVAVTAASGLAEWDGKETALDLFNRADHLMYCDKKTTPIFERAQAMRKTSAQSAMAPAGVGQMRDAG